MNPAAIRETVTGPAPTRFWMKPWWKTLVLIALPFIIYGFNLHRKFMFDDVRYIAEDPLLRSPDALRLFWFTSQSINCYPLFWTLLRFQWFCWGDQPFGYFAVNLVVHAVNGVLLWRVLEGWKVPGAWLVGALFVVHPVNVPTVAWAAEQKNTWSFFFMALTALAFTRYAEHGRRWHGSLTVIGFLAALACKTSCVGFSVFLLAFGWRRYPKLRQRLIPLLALLLAAAIAAGLTTVWFERHRVGVCTEMASLSLAQRSKAAGAAIWFYLEKAVAPVGLTPVYPGWTVADAAKRTAIPGLLFLAVLACGVRWWRELGAEVVLGLLYYTLMLLPLLGIFDTNYFAYCQIADHWQYHALPGVLVALTSIGVRLSKMKRFGALPVAQIASVPAIAVAAVLASAHFKHFENEFSFWSYVISRNPAAYLAWNNLAAAFGADGRWDVAVRYYRRAAQIAGTFQFRLDLAKACALSGNWIEAEQLYRDEERSHRWNVSVLNSHALALLHLNRQAEAFSEFQTVATVQPLNPIANAYLAIASLRRGQWVEAEARLPAIVADGNACQVLAQAVLAVCQDKALLPDARTFALHACQAAGRPEPSLLDLLKKLREGCGAAEPQPNAWLNKRNEAAV